MGCADCHTTDGANHTDGNAHGSNSEYLLKDSSGLAQDGTLDAKNNLGTYNCHRCHDPENYSGDWVLSKGKGHTGNDGDWTHTQGADGSARLTGDGNIFGMACFNCHGGVESGSEASPGPIEWGTIHGTSQTFGVGDNSGSGGGSGTRLSYRFMNGNSLRYYDPGGWSNGSTVTCYTIGSDEVDSFGACSHHTGGGADFGQDGKPIQRDLKY
jgi:hypothetical protein